MASTYTQNAGIEKPGTGDQSGTWGVTTNTNFDIIDRAVHGQVSIAISGSTDLTTSDGSVSNGIAPVVILTGSPGATFELRVTPTDQKKHYTIKMKQTLHVGLFIKALPTPHLTVWRSQQTQHRQSQAMVAVVLVYLKA